MPDWYPTLQEVSRAAHYLNCDGVWLYYHGPLYLIKRAATAAIAEEESKHTEKVQIE